MTGAIVSERRLTVPAPRETVWQRITDTDRINRLAGLSPVEFSPLEGAGAARHLGRLSVLGFLLVYEERPYEWAHGRRFSVRRVVRRGPLEALAMTYALADAPDGGTHVDLRLELTPRGSWVRPLARAGGRVIVGRLARAIAAAVAEPADSADLAPGGRHGVARARARLADGGEDPALVGALVDHVTSAPDPIVDRIRPYELADAWGRPRRAVLATCLAAVRAGLLELRWDLVCPSCRTGAERSRSLSQLGAEAHCHLCDIRIGVALDRSVEATFRPAPAVRRLEARTYCIGGPARTPHVVGQTTAAPGTPAALRAPAAPGSCRLFVRGGATARVEVDADAPGEVCVAAELAPQEPAGLVLAPAEVRVAPGGRIELRYGGTDERHVKLERREWAEQAATAHDVSLLPRFRDQFSDQLLVPGCSLEVGRVALLFSDLTGSTQLYTDVGDAAAFNLVQRHFEVLRRPIEAANGVIVKTIGDAVMAAFDDEPAAVRAAVGLLEAFPPFARQAGHPDVTLKLGVYAGACYAVTANGLLDYFGQTVNLAARLQGQAQGGELVVTADLAERAADQGWLGAAAVTSRFDARLKGVGGPVPSARIALPPSGEGATSG